MTAANIKKKYRFLKKFTVGPSSSPPPPQVTCADEAAPPPPLLHLFLHSWRLLWVLKIKLKTSLEFSENEATETLKVCLSFNQRIVNQSRTKPWFLFRTFFFLPGSRFVWTSEFVICSENFRLVSGWSLVVESSSLVQSDVFVLFCFFKN